MTQGSQHPAHQHPATDAMITGIILSGGAGRRFNGADKGLQYYQGSPMIEHVIHALAPQTQLLVLCVNRNQNIYERYGHPLVEDAEANFQGPIAGILAAMSYLESNHPDAEFCAVSPCDCPHLPTNYVERLLNSLGNKSVAVVSDGQRQQNLHCLIRKAAWAELQNYYSAGGRAMHGWYQKVDVIEVDFSDQADCFKNVNSPGQL